MKKMILKVNGVTVGTLSEDQAIKLEVAVNESAINYTVRKNLMNEPHYSPYCGNECRTMPRTKFNGQQFRCPDCGWVSKFPEGFIAEYKAKWGLK